MSRTLNDPLNGEEIKIIILQHIEDALNRNCTLSNDLTYPGFSMKFEANISFVRSSVPSTLVWGNKAQGEVGEGAETEKIEEVFACDAPDKTRVDHGLPVPCEFQTATGHERLRVKISKKAGDDAAKK